jgi:hypothetical protein
MIWKTTDTAGEGEQKIRKGLTVSTIPSVLRAHPRGGAIHDGLQTPGQCISGGAKKCIDGEAGRCGLKKPTEGHTSFFNPIITVDH